ncbi:hypothetical protein GUITHDRAFT_141266 [Guillardia theta CCMP2712]|uniref:Helicase ATP-binding domain-containing protein n=1 Tax=Guillardia theta (strain CCMP2712) TaxID=905079 RepID=L1J2H0_GUITC|nr:hypothetical protein GUITHDRAFT_141266 [Guillardia theta CCMP2712]EKX42314.1 hypothetical protein GUITHDRAFT_141266 [Guillardia theta CCMP2712]|eukprot:XP_005829294.1 hypothetical protein GUITHDRAFT_141266 [Guillardia theta CCMP2712]
MGIEEFKFPFSPYTVQVQLMTAVYGALCDGAVGIFESPTGTGKSMSLICSSLRWLKENPVYVKEDTTHMGLKDDDVPDWVLEHTRKREKQERDMAISMEKDRLDTARKRMADDARERSMHRSKDHKASKPTFHSKRSSGGSGDSSKANDHNKDDVKLLLSDEENDDQKILRSALDSLFQKPENEDRLEDEYDVRKVIYCSRTHSQLSQFMNEVKRTQWGKDLKAVSLASRKGMCINPKVSSLKSSTRINAACLDLQKGVEDTESNIEDAPSALKAKKKKSNCPFYDQDRQLDLRDMILARVQDIEDIVENGKKVQCCPYYASRAAIRAAELVTIPYTSLVHKATREALGLKLEGNVVIIDEAHNLIEAVTTTHSSTLSYSAITLLKSLFSDYLERFCTRLSAKNAENVRLIILVLKKLDQYMIDSESKGSEKGSLKKTSGEGKPVVGKTVSVAEFCIMAGIDNVNFFQLLRYFDKSKILQKLHGFYEKRLAEYHEKAGFDGEDELDEATGKLSLSYQLLNASTHFKEILQQAHSVVLAGGTMQPMAEYVQQLMPSIQPSRFRTLSVGHVIPKENILPLTVSTGPTGLKFDFRHGTRSDPTQKSEIGRLIVNICGLTPDGIVVFLPSYSYEEELWTYWTTEGLVDKIAKKKKIFREPRSSGEVEAVLRQYEECIRTQGTENTSPKDSSCMVDTRILNRVTDRFPVTGAILLCVVGGKLSEGINFSDELGRCVIVVGLPFANRGDPRLLEKIKYVESLPPVTELVGEDSKSSPTLTGAKAGQAYYQNMCMKAVNQCIGRAIRHIADYAAILLVDSRYEGSNVRCKITSWIRDKLTADSPTSFGPCYQALAKFFKSKCCQCPKGSVL